MTDISELDMVTDDGEKEAVKFYNDWVEEVKRSVPKERLLVFEVKSGWGPLCEFLGLPTPDTPFPNVNDSASINNVISTLNVLSKVVILIVPAILMVVLTYMFMA